MAIDNDKTERVLNDMRHVSATHPLSVQHQLAAYNEELLVVEAAVLEAVANDDTLFRAVELRRAELQRGGAPCVDQQSEPGGGAKVGPSTAAGEAGDWWPEVERCAHEVVVQWAIQEATGDDCGALGEAIEAMRDAMPRDAFEASRAEGQRKAGA